MDKPTKGMLARVAVVFGGAALMASVIIFDPSPGDGLRMLAPTLAAPVSAALLAPAVWWLMFVKKTKPLRLKRALGTGVLIAALSHPVWILILTVLALAVEPPRNGADLLMSLLAAPPVWGLLTLLFVFWLTLPLGALSGFFVFKWQQRAAGHDPRSEDAAEIER